MPASRLEVVTPPAAEPVTLDELKAHLRIDWGDEDLQLGRDLTAARQLFEKKTGRAVLPTRVRERVAGWPTREAAYLGLRLDLSLTPLVTVHTLTYRDPAGAAQTLAGWEADAGDYGGVYLPTALPPLGRDRDRPVCVEYTAGWPSLAAVPEVVRVAILLLAGHYYAVREAFTDGPAEMKAVPLGFQAICDMYWTGLDWGA